MQTEKVGQSMTTWKAITPSLFSEICIRNRPVFLQAQLYQVDIYVLETRPRGNWGECHGSKMGTLVLLCLPTFKHDWQDTTKNWNRKCCRHYCALLVNAALVCKFHQHVYLTYRLYFSVEKWGTRSDTPGGRSTSNHQPDFWEPWSARLSKAKMSRRPQSYSSWLLGGFLEARYTETVCNIPASVE